LVGEDEEGRLDGEIVVVDINFVVGEKVSFLVGTGVDLEDTEEINDGDFETGRREALEDVGFRVGIFVGFEVVAAISAVFSTGISATLNWVL